MNITGPASGVFHAPQFAGACSEIREDLGTQEPDALSDIVAGVEWIAAHRGGTPIGDGGRLAVVRTQPARGVPALLVIFLRPTEMLAADSELLWVEIVTTPDEEDS